MPEYRWDDAKNEQIKRQRRLSFEDVVYHINHGDLLADILHPNQQLHPGQRLYVVRVGDYAYEVPFYRIGDVEIFMTVYPSRKATRDYLPNGGHNER